MFSTLVTVAPPFQDNVVYTPGGVHPLYTSKIFSSIFPEKIGNILPYDFFIIISDKYCYRNDHGVLIRILYISYTVTYIMYTYIAPTRMVFIIIDVR